MTLAGTCSKPASSLFPQLCHHPATPTLALMEAPVMPTTTPTRASAHVDSTASTARKVMLDGEGNGARDGTGCALERSWGRGGVGRGRGVRLPSLRRQHHGELPAHSGLRLLSLIRNSVSLELPLGSVLHTSWAACASLFLSTLSLVCIPQEASFFPPQYLSK